MPRTCAGAWKKTYLQYIYACIVLKVNMLQLWLPSTCVWHAAGTDNIVGQNRVKCTCHFQKNTSLQFRFLKTSQAVDCNIGSFGSSGSYLASFDGSQNCWFLAMVRSCAGLKSLKTVLCYFCVFVRGRVNFWRIQDDSWLNSCFNFAGKPIW